MAMPPATGGVVVVWGLLARSPFGGMTWQVLHHLAGLRRLGFDVWYVEDSDSLASHPVTRERTADITDNAVYLQQQLERIGLGDRWAYRRPRSSEVVGALDRDGLRALYRSSVAVLNLCGAQELLDHHREAPRLVYVETDPVVNQVGVARGDARVIAELDAYDRLFTYGVNLGADDCRVPVTRYRWHPTVPPVIVDWWFTGAPPTIDAFTTVANWKHSQKDVSWNGELWKWSKHEQFRPFITLPSRVSVPLELALVGAGEELQELTGNGWRTRSAWTLADPMDYRDYIRSSMAEFSVAKEQYVAPRTGWFSDRTVCYLASGRPVVVEDTGFGRCLATGTGVVTFRDPAGAVEAVDAVTSNYAEHASAAIDIAREHFGAEAVLTRMMDLVLR